MKSWSDLVRKQVLRCPNCDGYAVVLQFRGDVVHTKCGCGYSVTESLRPGNHPDEVKKIEERFK